MGRGAEGDLVHKQLFTSGGVALWGEELRGIQYTSSSSRVVGWLFGERS